MKSIPLIILTALFLTYFAGCNSDLNCTPGSGPIVTQDIILDSFSQINFEVAGNVRIIEDSVQRVIIESHQNIINEMNTVISDDTWRIRFRRCFRNYDKFEVTIYTPEINGIFLSGSGNIQGENLLHSESFSVMISGSGSIIAMVDAESVFTDISGSGNINLSGSTRNQNINISGSGNVQTFDLASADCNITIPGSGNCEVAVDDNLNVVISGSGNVRYKGNPDVNSSISGSGTITKVN